MRLPSKCCLTTAVPDAPPELARIVAKALQKGREDRYQDVRDLVVDLKGLKRRLELDAELVRHSGEQSHAPLPAAGRGARRLGLLVGACLVAVMALAYAGYAGLFSGHAAVDSVAVLPFTNQAYKGKPVDPQEAARALGVKSVVTGRVAQHGANLLVGVELVDAADGTQIWGNQYTFRAADLLKVQAEISRDVVRNLQQRLTKDQRDRLSKRETVSREAYELAPQGRFHARQGSVDHQKKALEYFERAIAIDPNYAQAYVGLANSYRSLVFNGVLDPAVFTPKVEAAVRKAIALDHTVAEAHAALGTHLRDTWNWTGAAQAYERAIELNPSLAAAHASYASLLSSLGRHNEAIGMAVRSREFDPLNPLAGTSIGQKLFYARRYDDAIAVLERELDRGLEFIASRTSFVEWDCEGQQPLSHPTAGLDA